MRLVLIAVAIVVLALGAAGLYAVRSYDAPGPLAADQAVVVPRGATTAVAAALEQQHVVQHRWQFELAALLTSGQGSIRAGEFEFPAAASLADVLDILRTAKPVPHKLTIPEGLTAAQVAPLLARAEPLDGDTPAIPEGSLLPETYAFDRSTTRAALLARMTRAMDRALEAAWATRAPDLPLATSRDALILASIVERETAKPDERPLVAAVYLNRLRRGMKLQSDPTVVYGASRGAGTLDHGLTRAELDADTPYNTYRNAGLPPGPICMPGPAAIAAATHPADTADLFFVADGAGGHSFARTEQEHNRNVARWRQAERDRTPRVTP